MGGGREHRAGSQLASREGTLAHRWPRHLQGCRRMDTAAPSSGPALILSTPSCWERQACSDGSGGRGAEAQEERALPPKRPADGISKQGRVLPTHPAQSPAPPACTPTGTPAHGDPRGQRGHPWTALFSRFSFGPHLSTCMACEWSRRGWSVGTKEISVSINSAVAWPGCWLGVDPFLLGGAAQAGGPQWRILHWAHAPPSVPGPRPHPPRPPAEAAD